ncbi:MAG: hypothetical protein RRZ93_06535 [Ruthenibacterium sp.]
MSSEFSSIAKSRARYYCKGAPVQFVQVELLRINENDNMVVTLTFKNLVPQQLTALTAHFRCKDAGGAVILEDDFTYTELAIGEGGLFGGDDAVYVSEVPLSSVEVSLVSADYADGHSYSLQRCPPVPLPALRALNPQTVVDVNDLLQIDSARYLPANVVDGWQCTCGAFNYNVGQGKVMCAECGADKAALFSAVRTALQGGGVGQTQQLPRVSAQEPYLPVTDAIPVGAGVGDTAQYERPTEYAAADSGRAAAYDRARTSVIPAQRGAGVALMKTETADFILKFVPFITLGASTLYVLLMLLLNMLLH